MHWWRCMEKKFGQTIEERNKEKIRKMDIEIGQKNAELYISRGKN